MEHDFFLFFVFKFVFLFFSILMTFFKAKAVPVIFASGSMYYWAEAAYYFLIMELERAGDVSTMMWFQTRRFERLNNFRTGKILSSIVFFTSFLHFFLYLVGYRRVSCNCTSSTWIYYYWVWIGTKLISPHPPVSVRNMILYRVYTLFVYYLFILLYFLCSR